MSSTNPCEHCGADQSLSSFKGICIWCNKELGSGESPIQQEKPTQEQLNELANLKADAMRHQMSTRYLQKQDGSIVGLSPDGKEFELPVIYDEDEDDAMEVIADVLKESIEDIRTARKKLQDDAILVPEPTQGLDTILNNLFDYAYNKGLIGVKRHQPTDSYSVADAQIDIEALISHRVKEGKIEELQWCMNATAHEDSIYQRISQRKAELERED